MIEERLLQNSLDKLSIEYSDGQIKKLNRFYELLLRKNEVMNLTTITDYEDVVIKHFVDSLSVLNIIYLSEGMKCADLGTGAGFPGIPLAIFCPGTDFVLLDSVNKKLGFIEEAAKELDLKNVSTLHGRAEDIAHLDEHREKYDIVFSRAVSNLSTLSELTLGLVKSEGYFISYKSDNSSDEIKEAKPAIKIMGGMIEKEEDIELPYSDISRKIIFIKKIEITPKKYPRKAGEPARKPLSVSQ